MSTKQQQVDEIVDLVDAVARNIVHEERAWDAKDPMASQLHQNTRKMKQCLSEALMRLVGDA